MKIYEAIKKTILFISLLISIHSFSQSKDNLPKLQNEIKIDAFDLAFLTTLDASYERVNNPNYSYGISVLVNFKKENGYYEKFAVTPFFRLYFFNKEDYGAKGFFAEIFSKFASGEENIFNINNQIGEKYFDVALGLALGKKWVSRKGFTVEFSLGGGRNLGLDENSPEFSFRGGVSLGYRF